MKLYMVKTDRDRSLMTESKTWNIETKMHGRNQKTNILNNFLYLMDVVFHSIILFHSENYICQQN